MNYDSLEDIEGRLAEIKSEQKALEIHRELMLNAEKIERFESEFLGVTFEFDEGKYYLMTERDANPTQWRGYRLDPSWFGSAFIEPFIFRVSDINFNRMAVIEQPEAVELLTKIMESFRKQGSFAEEWLIREHRRV